MEKMNLMIRHGIRPGAVKGKLSVMETLLYLYKLRYFGMLTAEFCRRVVNKILRILKIKH